MKDRVMLAAAYVLLVGVVAYMTWWLEDQIGEIRRTQCQALLVQIDTLSVLIVDRPDAEESVQSLDDEFSRLCVTPGYFSVDD